LNYKGKALKIVNYPKSDWEVYKGSRVKGPRIREIRK
jgi:hypothetical protein